MSNLHYNYGKLVTEQLQITSGATDGYVLTSDASGNGGWQPNYIFTGNTSASCINDLYVTNLNSCSPLHIQPTNNGDVYISESGGNVGIGTTNPQTTLDINGDVNVSNSISATTYYGDGSNLSGISTGVQSVTGLDTDNADPLNPIVQISVDGVTITGDGTPSNPLVSVADGVQSVTGLNTDNTDPANPIIEIAVDGVTITGNGTLANPLVAAGGSDYTETIVNISSAQILSMGTTPIELLPAPGVGMYYDIDKVVLESSAGNSYTIGAYDLPYIGYGSIYEAFPVGIMNASRACITNFKGIKFDATLTDNICPTLDLNTSIIFSNWSGTNYTDGTGTLRVKIYHKTITFGA